MLPAKPLKAQVSLVDLFLLVFFMALLLAVSAYAGHQSITSEVTREESMYAQSMLQSLMGYRNASFGSYTNHDHLSISDAINLYYCYNGISGFDLNRTVTDFLNKAVKPDYNYILFSMYNHSGDVKVVWAWNRQATMCAQYIPIKAFPLKLTCKPDFYQEPILGIWPSWKVLPEGCDLWTEG